MIVDLFSGADGWGEGLRMIGRTDAVGIEADEAACATARAAGHESICSDVRAVNPNQFLGVEGLIASPPCQPFSDNGKRGGLSDPRGVLVHEHLRFIRQLRPAWVACEQVRSVLPIWKDHAIELRLLGYTAWAGLVDAVSYGVPQRRTRAVLLARLDKQYPHLPAETHGPLRWVSQGRALGWDNPRDWYVNTGLDWKKGQPRESAQKIPGSQPSTTITTRSVGQWRVYPPGLPYRGLTEREASILQTFPADYPWQGTTQLARATQIGNAIPPLFAANLLRAVGAERIEAAA